MLAVTIDSNHLQPGIDYTITDSESITIKDNVVIDTSSPGGKAGIIKLNAPVIHLGDNVQLLAIGDTPGSITLTATYTWADPTLAFWDFLQSFGYADKNFQKADIDIGSHVTINGGAFTATATAGDNAVLKDSEATPFLGQFETQIFSNLNDLIDLPLSGVYKAPSATVTVGIGSHINSTGNVSLTTSSTANAQGEAIFSTLMDKVAKGTAGYGGFAAGVTYTDVKAVTTVSPEAAITASGSVTVSSNVANTAAMKARVTQNLGIHPTNPSNIQVSFGMVDLHTTSTALVDTKAVITAGGNVSVTATGKDTDQVSVSTASYRDGKAGVVVGIGLTTADVHATVNGTIHAGAAPVPASQTFNPALTVDFSTSSLNFATAPGYQTGDPLVYTSGLGGAIPGLVTGDTYFAIIPQANPQTVQLAASLSDALSGKHITFGPAYPTLSANGRSIPITLVQVQGDNADNSNLFLFDYTTLSDGKTPLFTEGEYVTYTPATGNYLGYNDGAGKLLGALPAGSYKVHIVHASADSQGLYSIQLLDAGNKVVPLNDNPVFTTTGGQLLQVYSFDADTGEVNFNFPDHSLNSQGITLTNGQLLTYTQGLGTRVAGLADAQSYFAIVDPANPGVIRLANSLAQAQTADPSTQRSQPTLSVAGRTLTIASVEPDLGLVLAANPSITDGTAVVYHAVAHKPIGGLIDGNTYYAFNQTNPYFDADDPAYVLVLKQEPNPGEFVPVALSLTQTLTDSLGNAYSLQSTNSLRNFLTVASSTLLDISAVDNALLVGGTTTLQTVAAGSQQFWTNATGGTFTVSTVVNSQTHTTAPMAFDASATQLQNALNQLGLDTIVTGLGTYADPWLVNGADLPGLTIDDTQLISGNAYGQMAAAGSRTLSSNATGGTFTLSALVDGTTRTTAPIAYNARAEQVEAALQALNGVRADVTGAGTASNPWLISGAIFLIQSGAPLTFGDALGLSSHGLLDGQTYYAAVAPSQPYPGVLLLALATTPSQATAPSPTAVSLSTTIELGEINQGYLSGSQHTLEAATATSGISIGATLTSKDKQTNKAATGGEPKFMNFVTQGDLSITSIDGMSGWERSVQNLFGRLEKGKTFGDLIKEQAGGQPANNSFTIAATVGYLECHNTALATVGSSAELTATGSVSVTSKLSESTQTQVSSSVTKPKIDEGASTGTAIGAAVNIAQFFNTSHAVIETNAHVTAAQNLQVNSQVTYPWAWQITNPNGFSAETFFANNTISNLNTYLGGNLGIDGWLVNSWTQSLIPSAQNKLSLTASISWFDYTNDCLAQIAEGAQINQDDSITPTAEQGVSVTATTSVVQVGYTGLVGIDFSPEKISKVIRDHGQSSFLNLMRAEGSAVGGSFGHIGLDNTTQALVGGVDPAGTPNPGTTRVRFGNGGLKVNATGNVTYVQLTQGGGDGQQYAISGTLGLPEITNKTLARIFSGAVVQAQATTNGGVTVAANDDLDLITTAGGVLTSKNVAVGVSTCVDSITRTVIALIGEDQSNPNPGSSTFNVNGPIKVQANATGVIVSAAVAASIRSVSAPPGKPENVENHGDQQAGDQPQASYGWAVSGDFSWVSLADTVLAYINDGGTFTGANAAFQVSSNDITQVISVGGAAAFALSGNQSSVGLAGSASVIDVSGSVKAFVHLATLTQFAVTVTATDDKTLVNLSAGGSGSTVGNSSTAIAGSVAVTTLHDTTILASLDGVTATLAGNSQISASDETTLVTVGGAFVKGGKGGYGMGATVNNVDHTTQALVANSQITQTTGGLTVSGTDSLSSVSIAAGLALTETGLAVSGMFADNVATSTTQAAISGGSYLNHDQSSGGSLTVEATNRPTVVTLAGDVSANKNGNLGIGAAVAYASLDTPNSATISGTTVTLSGGHVDVTSTSGDPPAGFADPALDSLDLPGRSNHALYTFSIGGSGSRNLSLAGSVTVNEIHGSNLAAINQNATISAPSSVVLQATNGSTIGAEAGAVTASPEGKLAFGAAVVVNSINTDSTDTTEAVIDSSQVTTTGDIVSVKSLSNLLIGSAAASGNGAEAVATGGSVVTNTIGGGTQAIIQNSPKISAGTGLTLSARNTSKIGTGAGEVSIATQGSTVGASIAVNEISGEVLGSVQGSTVTVGGPVAIQAQTSSTIDAYAVGVAGAAGAANPRVPIEVGLVGSGASNIVTGTTQALIESGSSVITSKNGSVSLTAGDSSAITAVAGEFSLQLKGKGGFSPAVGASAATNTLGSSSTPNKVRASIDDSTVNAVGIGLTATANTTVLAVTAAGSGDFSKGDATSVGIAGAGSGSGNTSIYTVQATVSNGSQVATTNGSEVNLSASNSSSIKAIAGGVAVAGAKSGTNAVAVTVGAALAINTITNTTQALVQSSTVNSDGDVKLSALHSASIEAYTIGVSGSTAKGGTLSVAVGLVGSGSGNTINGATQASVQANSSINTSSSGDLKLSAVDNSTVTAVGGSLSVSIGTASTAVGVSAATNTLGTSSNPNLVQANIENSTVFAGGVRQSASAHPTINAYTVAGGGDFSRGQTLEMGIAGAGAGSGNSLVYHVDALIAGGSQVTAMGSGPIHLTADDTADIEAIAGGLALAGGVGGATGVAVTVGAAAATNTITSEVHADVQGSTVQAVSDVELEATNNVSIEAHTAGVAGSLNKGGTMGIDVGGAGSGSGNTITNTTSAAIVDRLSGNATIRSRVTSNGNVLLTAKDSSEIVAGAGAAAIAIGLGSGKIGLATAMGASAAVNSITSAVTANINNSTVKAQKLVELSAATQPPAGKTYNILAVTVAGGGAITTSASNALAFAGAGAGSGNTIQNTVTASITNCQGNDSQKNPIAVTSQTENVMLSAQDNAAILADGGGATVTFARGTGSAAVGVAMGMGYAKNTITNTVTASADGSTVSAHAGQVILSSVSTSQAKATGFGVALDVSLSNAGGFSAAGSGAGAYNNLKSTIQACLQNGSVVTAGKDAPGAVELDAEDRSTATASAGAGSLSVAIAPDGVGLAVGAVVAQNNLNNTVSAIIGHTTSTGDTTVVTSSGGMELTATELATATATAVAVAATLTISPNGGAFPGSGANATNTSNNAITAAIQGGAQAQTCGALAADRVTLTAADSINLNATVGTGSLAVGFVGASIGVSLATNTVTDTVTACIRGAKVTTQGPAVTIRASSDNSIASMAVATAATVGIGVAGAGGNATSTDNSAVSAYVDPGSTIQTNDSGSSYGALSVTASSHGTVSAEIDGGAGGIGSIGVFFANASCGGSTTAYVDGSANLTIGDLAVSSTAGHAVSSRGWTLTVGWLTGDGTTATTTVQDSVLAYFGTPATTSVPATLPTFSGHGSAQITASAANTASAAADGGVGSLGWPVSLGVGVYAANTTQKPQVNSYVRGINVSIPGAVIVTGAATNSTDADSTAGSGGMVAGDAALADTADSTTVSAGLYGGTFHAASFVIGTNNNSSYAPKADSINAAVVGGSGAVADHVGNTAATTTLADGTSLSAYGAVSVTAFEQFHETATGDNASAGAGGVVNGSAAVSGANLKGNASVSVGKNVVISSGTDFSANPGGIVIGAATGASAEDQVTLTTGGGIEGAKVNSKLTAKFDNAVTVGDNSSFSSLGNIGIGTSAIVSVQNNSAINTYGLAGVGEAYASATVTSTQNVTVGNNASLTAFGNINLTPGADPVTVSPSMLSGSTSAQGYVRGLVAIPQADADTTMTSSATLSIGTGTQVSSGQNITAGAYTGTPVATADGTGRGYELGFIPATSSNSSTKASTSSSTILNGTLNAGIYHELTITIPNDHTVAPAYSKTLNVNPDGSPYITFGSNFIPSFKAPDYIGQHFTGDTAAVLNSGVSSQNVGAYSIGSLFASGGTVTLNADSLMGSGSINAYGGPTISINNYSADYLILGPITIPNLPGGTVSFTGLATRAPVGMKINQSGLGQEPAIVINQNYAGSVGNVSYGPALFLMGDIQNLGGSVAVTNSTGSLGQTATIFANKVTISVPEGAAAIDIPDGTYYVDGNPYSDWNKTMIWPGGDPATGVPNADYAVSYVANAVYNPCSTAYTDQDFARYFLYGTPGNQYPANQSTVFFGSSLPYVNGAGDDTKAINSQWSVWAGSTNDVYAMGHDPDNSSNNAYFPLIPYHYLKATATSHPAADETPAIFAGEVSIHAKTIDLNGKIEAGKLKNWSVSFPKALGDTLAAYRQGYLQGKNPAIYAIPLDATTRITDTDNLITASYNAESNQIILDNVTVSVAARVTLNGAIISTHSDGNIQVVGGYGQVTVDNQTDITLVVRDITADEEAAASRIDITDTNLPADSNRTLYVSSPGSPVEVYVGQAGDVTLGTGTPTRTIYDTSTSYSPLSDIRWQWVEQAKLYRTIQDKNTWQLSNWAWDYPSGSPNDPWQYVDPVTGSLTTTPVGKTVVEPGLPLFQETVTGSIDQQFEWTITYHDGHYGFANNGGSSDWHYYYPLNASLTLTNSVKADNPITLDFSGVHDQGALSITSRGDILIAGDVRASGLQESRIEATNGSLTNASGASLWTGDLTLHAGHGIGVPSAPMVISQRNNGFLSADAGSEGIYLYSTSPLNIGRLASGTSGTPGNVDVRAYGGIDFSTSYAQNISGSNITLVSETGGIGTSNRPTLLQCQGVLNANAVMDITFKQVQGDLRVGQIISTRGELNIAVPQGSLYDAVSWIVPGLSSSEEELIHQRLGLKDSTAAQTSVTAFQNLVHRDYQIYWQLRENGSVQNGTYTLSDSGLAYYRASLTGQKQAIASDDDIRNYCQTLYENIVDFFNAHLQSGWQSDPEFKMGATGRPLYRQGPFALVEHFAIWV